MIHNKSKLGLNATTPLHLGIQRQVANGPAGSLEVKNPDVFDFDLETTKKFDFYLEDVDEEKNSNSRFKKIFTTSFDKNPKQSFTTERPNLLNPLERGKSSQRRKASESAGSFSSGGLATRKNMEQVIGHIMQNQEQFPFSMIFKDPQLEVQYLHEIHLENKSAVKIPFILITLMACSVIVGDCIRLINNQINQFGLYINIPLVCCVWIQSFIHYKYTAKNVRALQLFAPLQSLIIMIVGLEVSIIGGVKIAEVDGLSATSAVATSFVVLYNNQLEYLVSQLSCVAYYLLRTYGRFDDKLRYFRYNTYMIVVFIFLMIISRAYIRQTRANFLSKHRQERLLQLFQNLIKLYHDGIIIASKDEVLFQNQKVMEIFNISPSIITASSPTLQKNDPQSTTRATLLKNGASPRIMQRKLSQINQEDSSKKVIAAMCNSRSVQKEGTGNSVRKGSSISRKANGNNSEVDGMTMWEYIQNVARKQSLIDQNLKIASGPEEEEEDEEEVQLDGQYFKFKPEVDYAVRKRIMIRKGIHQSETSLQDENMKSMRSSQYSKAKKLQVFSQAQTFNGVGSALLIISIRDMSKWIELERQKNLTKMKTVAFAQAAHEFRNPLNGINISLSLLEDMYDKVRGEIYFRTAKSCTDLMLSLVRDILDMSQLESKSFVLNLQPCSIETLIKETILIFSIQAQQRSIEIQFQNSLAQGSATTKTDLIRLKQILINLISNAIKYTQHYGTIKVIAESDTRSRQIMISVVDTGVGMNEDQIDVLFQNFTKFQSDRKMNQEGVGLGLSISRNIARALGGDIKVQSQLGKGSRFTLVIPHEPVEEVLKESDVQIIIQRDSFAQLPHIETTSQNEAALVKVNQIQSFFSIPRIIQPKSQNLGRSGSFLVSNLKSHEQIRFESRHDVADQDSSTAELVPAAQACACPSILIADDEPLNLLVLSGVLTRLNYDPPDQAQNGKDVLDKLKFNAAQCTCSEHQPYRLILIDNQMPLMSGVEATRQIREMQQRGQLSKQIKIVLVSGGDERHLYEDLFDEYLPKPIDSVMLQAMLARYL